MNNVLLISENTVKSTTNLSDNLNGDFILPAIKLAQDIELEETIGTQLLDKLKSLIYNNTINQEQNLKYKKLIDKYIQPFLCYATIAHITVPIAFKLANAGVLRTEDEKMYNVSADEVDKVKWHYQHIADTYKYRLQRYLIANYSQYPELMEYKSIADLRVNLYSAAKTNLWLGGARGKQTFDNSLFWGYGLPSSTIELT